MVVTLSSKTSKLCFCTISFVNEMKSLAAGHVNLSCVSPNQGHDVSHTSAVHNKAVSSPSK